MSIQSSLFQSAQTGPFDQCILRPVAHLTAPLPPVITNVNGGQIYSGISYPRHFVEKQLVARVIGASASLFAGISAIYTITVVTTLGSYLLASRVITFLPPCIYSSSEITSLMKRVPVLVFLTCVGSIIGVIYPKALLSYSFCPHSDEADFDVLMRKAPNNLIALVEKIRNKEENLPESLQNELTNYWQNAPLSHKDLFVRVFSNEMPNFERVRNFLADTVSTSIRQNSNDLLRWLPPTQVRDAVTTIREKNLSQIAKSYYFHATPTQESLESILKGRRVKVMHERAFKGAFVSTQPETGFGDYILVFKKAQIERLSHLEHGFSMGYDRFWAGFSQDIPVTESTLAHIVLNKDSDRDIEQLKETVKQWTGRDISVFRKQAIDTPLQNIHNLNLGVPKEWTTGLDSSKDFGNTVLKTMQARAQAAKTKATTGRDPSIALTLNGIISIFNGIKILFHPGNQKSQTIIHKPNERKDCPVC
jgi:hypothetical protein